MQLQLQMELCPPPGEVPVPVGIFVDGDVVESPPRLLFSEALADAIDDSALVATAFEQAVREQRTPSGGKGSSDEDTAKLRVRPYDTEFVPLHEKFKFLVRMRSQFRATERAGQIAQREGVSTSPLSWRRMKSLCSTSLLWCHDVESATSTIIWS